MRPSLGTLLLSLLLGLTVAACSGGGGATAPTGTSGTATATVAATDDGAASSEPSATASAEAAAETVNANTATVEELQAAFEAAGISNADKWAREVAEYRPYDADPTWAQLRQELGKYNIAADVLERIISVLEV